MNEITNVAENAVATQVSMPTAVNVWSDKSAFDQMTRVAMMLSKSTIVPQNFQGKPEDCFIAVEMAARMNTSPIFIMQNLYVVKGKPSWAGQACMAMIMSCGKFRSVKHVYTGEKGTDSRGCYVTAERISDGEIINGTEVTIQMAKNEGWLSNSKWKNMPEQMLGYRAASFFARMYCPEALMGLQTAEEIYDVSGGDREPKNEPVVLCGKCGKEIQPYGNITVDTLALYTKRTYGVPLCSECAKIAKAQKQAETEAEQTEEKKGEQNG